MHSYTAEVTNGEPFYGLGAATDSYNGVLSMELKRDTMANDRV